MISRPKQKPPTHQGGLALRCTAPKAKRSEDSPGLGARRPSQRSKQTAFVASPRPTSPITDVSTPPSIVLPSSSPSLVIAKSHAASSTCVCLWCSVGCESCHCGESLVASTSRTPASFVPPALHCFVSRRAADATRSVNNFSTRAFASLCCLSVFAVALAVACLRALASPFCIANDMVSLKRRSHATSSSSACATQSHEFGQAQEWARFYCASGRLPGVHLTSSCPTSRARDSACISRVPHALGMNCSLRPVSTEGFTQTCRAVLHCRTGHGSVKSMTEELWDFEFPTTSMHSTFFLTCRTPVTMKGDSRLRRRTGWTRTDARDCDTLGDCEERGRRREE